MFATPPSRLAFGSISWYSLIIVFAIALAVYLCEREEKRLHLPKDIAIDSALMAIPLGIVGARLYYVAFTWREFASDPIRILYVWEGGVAIYGALLGGFLAVFLTARRKKASLLFLLDMFAPSLALAQALGRWGNYFNMEAYGEAVTNPAWQFFPFAVFIPSSNAWHLATFFYESCWDLITFALLMAFRKRMSRKGDVFFWYLLLYGAGRTVVEGLRTDSLWLTETIRVSQGLSLVLIAAGLIWFAIRAFRQEKHLVPLIATVCFSFFGIFLFAFGGGMPGPVVNAVLMVLFVLGLALNRKGKNLALLVPYAVLAAGLAAFLFFFPGEQNTLLLRTVFTVLISLSYPAAALAVY